MLSLIEERRDKQLIEYLIHLKEKEERSEKNYEESGFEDDDFTKQQIMIINQSERYG